DNTTAAKAQYMHETATALADVTELSYYSKREAASFPDGNASYQLAVFLDGTEATFTTLVYEPYWNGGTGVPDNTWTPWDVYAGQFWSSRTVTAGACSVVAGSGGPPLYTLAALKAACPNAIVVGFGVNVGTYNPSYNIVVDLVSFNGTAYNFERTFAPVTSDDCKKGGWQLRTDGDGNGFRNQGDCIQYVNTGK
ncbi:MAG: hypothetical protein M3Y37_05835, partial [Chloroflexota bacterium]|nr:hypothetical protein [Chloroflexota bacterium]